jgi:NAD(P) transhydrogenase subunit alpha
MILGLGSSACAAASDVASQRIGYCFGAWMWAGANDVASESVDYWSLLFVLVLATFIGLGVILRVSRLLHTPLMSLTNAISAIAVVGSILVAGSEVPTPIRVLGAVALFASMTNIVSGFMITDRMLKMFKTPPKRGDTSGGASK